LAAENALMDLKYGFERMIHPGEISDNDVLKIIKLLKPHEDKIKEYAILFL